MSVSRKGERVIYYEEGAVTHPTMPDESVVRNASVLLVDQTGVPGQLRMGPDRC